MTILNNLAILDQYIYSRINAMNLGVGHVDGVVAHVHVAYKVYIN